MASYYSPDLFLENVHIVVIFLSDGLIAHISDYNCEGRIHQSGDIVQLNRSQDKDDLVETAVILGWGECEADAVSQSREYFKRLAKWHGHDARLSEFKILGHSVVESQYFEDIDESD